MTTGTPLATLTAGNLIVHVHRDRAVMGRAAAAAVASRMRDVLADKGRLRMVFASAPSQVEFLEALAGATGIEWRRVTAFHMDEYIGLPTDAPQGFGRFIREQLIDRVGVGTAHYLDGRASPADECARYGRLIREAPLDIVCMGIGENGHVAFNDPPVADFDDPETVKVVTLDERCRRQQVNDGCFPSLNDVPRTAMTLTIPALMAGTMLSVVVPAPSKAEAVAATVHGVLSTACPASILRTHLQATLHLDADSARLLMPW
jgi:glucosamine-6-phosphate deaminase